MKKILVCLHGWGGTKESFTELRSALEGSGIEILAPDLPGFGSEPEPKEPWTNDEYADWVERWIEKRVADSGKRVELFLLGHSHGGRIAIKLAHRQSTNRYSLTATRPIEHLFLCAPAGIRHPRHFKRIIGLMLAKTGKFFLTIPGFQALAPFGKKLLYKLVRVHDYEHASPVMQQTMIHIAAEDFRPILKDISVSVDLFWGRDDTMTPLSDAFLMKKELPHATLHVYDRVRHRVHRDKAREIAEVIRARMSK